MFPVPCLMLSFPSDQICDVCPVSLFCLRSLPSRTRKRTKTGKERWTFTGRVEESGREWRRRTGKDADSLPLVACFCCCSLLVPDCLLSCALQCCLCSPIL